MILSVRVSVLYDKSVAVAGTPKEVGGGVPSARFRGLCLRVWSVSSCIHRNSDLLGDPNHAGVFVLLQPKEVLFLQ